MKITVIAVLTTSGLAIAAPAGAAATASGYGHHVRHCAQTMGFSGGHNPGLHRGRSGWDPTHTCDPH